MGTEAHGTSYLPGFYTMMDLNENADGYWSHYYGDKTLSRNCYNDYQPRPSNRYSEYDKEMLRRTMLEHEAIFRKQVYELHRLYRIQMDMMNELKKGPCRHLEASIVHLNSFSSYMPPESTNGLFHMATMNNNGAPRTVIDDKKPILNFLNRNGEEIGIKDGDMSESNHKGPKRMFDLQLPADVYIDFEVAERSEKEIVDMSSSIANNAKVALDMVEGPNSREESMMSNIHGQLGPTPWSLADLNEDSKEIHFGREVGSVSAKFIGSKPPYVENQGLLLPMRANTNFSGIPSTFIKGKHWDEGTSSNHLHADDDETNQEWSFFNKQAGQVTSSGKLFNRGSFKEKFSVPSKQIQLNQEPRDILSPDQNNKETWFTSKLKTSERDFHNGHSTMLFPNQSFYAFLDYTSAPSPLVSSWTKPANGYSRNCSRDLSSHSRVGVDSTYYENGYNHYSAASQFHNKQITFDNHEGCGPRKSQKDVSWNQPLLNGFRNGITTQKNNGSETKCGVSSMAVPWLREKPACKSSYMMELDLSHGYPQLKMNPRYEVRHEIEKNVNLFNLQDLPSSSHVKETTMEMDVASYCQSSKKIFGFSIPEKTQLSVATDYNIKDKSLISLEDPGAKSFRNHINLNIDLNSSDLSAECEMLEASLQQASALSVAPKIDLEAPIVLQEENADDLIREAAESMLLMSSDKLPPVSYSTLHWFAEVVSSRVDDEKENSDYTLDSFELMTLNLEETKPEEYLCPCWEEQNQKDDGDDDDGKRNIASLLFTKPRRGQARKRRKRDFQKDILPGLASLSRQAVMEDLQTIGGTMRRNSTRNGTNCRGRKPRSLAITIEKIHVTPPPLLPPPLEVEIDGKNMIGWGRTTRRCRRQRFTPITNAASPLT